MPDSNHNKRISQKYIINFENQMSLKNKKCIDDDGMGYLKDNLPSLFILNFLL